MSRHAISGMFVSTAHCRSNDLSRANPNTTYFREFSSLFNYSLELHSTTLHTGVVCSSMGTQPLPPTAVRSCASSTLDKVVCRCLRAYQYTRPRANTIFTPTLLDCKHYVEARENYWKFPERYQSNGGRWDFKREFPS